MPFGLEERQVEGGAVRGLVTRRAEAVPRSSVSQNRGAAAGRYGDLVWQVGVLLFPVPLGFSVQPVFCVFYFLSFSGLNFLFLGEFQGGLQKLLQDGRQRAVCLLGALSFRRTGSSDHPPPPRKAER